MNNDEFFLNKFKNFDERLDNKNNYSYLFINKLKKIEKILNNKELKNELNYKLNNKFDINKFHNKILLLGGTQESNIMCSICLSPLYKIKSNKTEKENITCTHPYEIWRDKKHYFHYDCIKPWIKKGLMKEKVNIKYFSCPLCRTETNTNLLNMCNNTIIKNHCKTYKCDNTAHDDLYKIIGKPNDKRPPNPEWDSSRIQRPPQRPASEIQNQPRRPVSASGIRNQPQRPASGIRNQPQRPASGIYRQPQRPVSASGIQNQPQRPAGELRTQNQIEISST